MTVVAKHNWRSR